ncbi:TPA: hypothetical protein DDZ86_00030 [Candidatus Dependentiae bacterium]|nr:MAG: hypothetical protein UW09_C0002G0112 [candidate division TM6 bacterium GW2011_GWF2_43_87]HBL98015.1 hypothetical protein [Candidatus Dependentiae bacterium]
MSSISLKNYLNHRIAVLMCTLASTSAPMVAGILYPASQQLQSTPVRLVNAPRSASTCPFPVLIQNNSNTLRKLAKIIQKHPMTSLFIGAASATATYVIADLIYSRYSESLISNSPNAIQAPLSRIWKSETTSKKISEDIDSWKGARLGKTLYRCVKTFGLYNPLVSRIYRNTLVKTLNESENQKITKRSDWSTKWSGNFFVYHPNTALGSSSYYKEELYIDETKNNGTIATLKSLLKNAQLNNIREFEIHVYHTLNSHSESQIEYITDRSHGESINSEGITSFTTQTTKRPVANNITTYPPIILYVRPQDKAAVQNILGNLITSPSTVRQPIF